MYKCLAFVAVYSGFLILGFIQGRGQSNPLEINQESTHTADLCCVGTWSAKPVWTLAYDPGRDIVLLGSCGCVCVLDVSDPHHPERIIEFKHSQCNTCGLFYQSETNLIFICDGISGLKIWNLFNLAKPVEVGTIDTPGYACAVHVVGIHAYVADGDGGLRIINVSNPAQPCEISHIDMTTACHVHVEGSYAYVADLGLRIIDVSNPHKPKEVAFQPTPGVAYGIYIYGNKAYIADDWSGIRIIDVSDIARPREIGHLKMPGYAWDIKVSGTLAFVAAYDGGLRIIDISNATRPREIAFHDTPDKALQTITTGSQIFVAAASKGLSVYSFDR